MPATTLLAEGAGGAVSGSSTSARRKRAVTRFCWMGSAPPTATLALRCRRAGDPATLPLRVAEEEEGVPPLVRLSRQRARAAAAPVTAQCSAVRFRVRVVAATVTHPHGAGGSVGRCPPPSSPPSSVDSAPPAIARWLCASALRRRVLTVSSCPAAAASHRVVRARRVAGLVAATKGYLPAQSRLVSSWPNSASHRTRRRHTRTLPRPAARCRGVAMWALRRSGRAPKCSKASTAAGLSAAAARCRGVQPCASTTCRGAPCCTRSATMRVASA